MSPSPPDARESEAVARYGTSWAALMELVREGHSWSGHERGCVYLSESGERFADISSLSGLDAPDDGRALGIVDWDQDGDLDIWCRSRTAPRLRLMLNRRETGDSLRSVALLLRGTRAHRDAIGAVAEVVLVDEATGAPLPRLVRSVRAGDLFLSQSSRWLHFGLGDAGAIREVRVLWPGGARETFRGVERGGRCLIEEGAGEARPWRPRVARESIALAEGSRGENVGSAGSLTSRAPLPHRVSLPRLAFRDLRTRNTKPAIDSATARLVLAWSASCAHCQGELAELAKSEAILREAGVDIVAFAVDEPAANGADPAIAAARVIDETGFPFPWGVLVEDSAALLHEFHATLFDRAPEAGVPLAFLTDAAARAVAVYRGPVSAETIVADARSLVPATNAQLHDRAPPFAGRWFTRAVDEGAVAEFLARHLEARFPEAALDYVELAAATADGEHASVLRKEAIDGRLREARRRDAEERPELAAPHYEAALRLAPGAAEIALEYGRFLATWGRLADAETWLDKALALRPDLAGASEALDLVRRLRREEGGKP